MQIWDADATAVDSDSTVWRFTPKSWDEHLNADTHFEFNFHGRQWEDYEVKKNNFLVCDILIVLIIKIGHIWKTEFCSPDGVGNNGQTTTTKEGSTLTTISTTEGTTPTTISTTTNVNKHQQI